ncbi:MAG: class I SAM-dependent methyltransferase [Bryobacteraceae bacterium]
MPASAVPQERARGFCYAIEYKGGTKQTRGEGVAAFTLLVADEPQLESILKGDDYSVAQAYVRGEFEVRGDLAAALRLKRKYTRSRFFQRLWSAAAQWGPSRIETWFQSKERAAENIHYHYDVSNEFYAKFLDSRMVYSEGYFEDPGWSLERAQQAKLDGICRDLDLRPGERFLDVGCGWGALLIEAAECYGAQATGCTLSRGQHDFAVAAIAARGLEKRVTVREMDYRDICQRFDKIASIGMFEHVGRHRLGKYFQKIYSLLEDGGLFLNSGITRPQAVKDDPQTWFLLKRVFPGGELAHLPAVMREAERAGFRILKVRNLAKDYARTCQIWVERLREKRESCIRLVGEERYRTWLLYLAASAASFEDGHTEVFSILTVK